MTHNSIQFIWIITTITVDAPISIGLTEKHQPTAFKRLHWNRERVKTEINTFCCLYSRWDTHIPTAAFIYTTLITETCSWFMASPLICAVFEPAGLGPLIETHNFDAQHSAWLQFGREGNQRHTNVINMFLMKPQRLLLSQKPLWM